jgi:hypothetical protein
MKSPNEQLSDAERVKKLEAIIAKISSAKSLKEVRSILGLDSDTNSSPVLRLSSNSLVFKRR